MNKEDCYFVFEMFLSYLFRYIGMREIDKLLKKIREDIIDDIKKLPPELLANHLKLLRIIDQYFFREEKRRYEH